MKTVDMSSKAVTARLKRVAQLRRLCLALQKAKLPTVENNAKDRENKVKSRPDGQSSK